MSDDRLKGRVFRKKHEVGDAKAIGVHLKPDLRERSDAQFFCAHPEPRTDLELQPTMLLFAHVAFQQFAIDVISVRVVCG